MRIHDLPPGFDDPVEALLGFHRRIERHLGTLGKIATHLEVRGPDAEASAMAATVLDFFTGAIVLHHADEEDLMPILEMRLAATEQGDALRAMRERLESEHREMDRTWRILRRPLESIAEGVRRAVPLDLLQYYRAVQTLHISIEEGCIHRAAQRSLLSADRATLGRGMVARRTRKLRFA